MNNPDEKKLIQWLERSEPALCWSLGFTPSLLSALVEHGIIKEKERSILEEYKDKEKKASIFINSMLRNKLRTFEQFIQCLQESSVGKHKTIAKYIRRLETPEMKILQTTLKVLESPALKSLAKAGLITKREKKIIQKLKNNLTRGKIPRKEEEAILNKIIIGLQNTKDEDLKKIASPLPKTDGPPHEIPMELVVNIVKSCKPKDDANLDWGSTNMKDYLCYIMDQSGRLDMSGETLTGVNGSFDSRAQEVLFRLRRAFQGLMPNHVRLSDRGISFEWVCLCIDDCERLRIATKTKALLSALSQCVTLCWPDIVKLPDFYNYAIEGTLHCAHFGGPLVTTFHFTKPYKDPNVCYLDGTGGMLRSAECGATEAMVSFMNGVSIDSHSMTGETALMLAAANGHKETVSKLLELGADVSRTDQKGKTALVHAAANGHKSTVSTLLRLGADMDCMKDGDLEKGLVHAVRGKHLAVIQEIVEHTKTTRRNIVETFDKPFNIARKIGLEKVLQVFLTVEEYLLAVIPEFGRFLFDAVGLRQDGVAALFLKHGADPNVISNLDGFTPLMVAVALNNKEGVKILLDHGANPEITAKEQHTALLQAAKAGKQDIMDLLLQYSRQQGGQEDEMHSEGKMSAGMNYGSDTEYKTVVETNGGSCPSTVIQACQWHVQFISLRRGDFCISLIEAGVITRAEGNHLYYEGGNALCAHLCKKGKHIFDRFLRCLEETHLQEAATLQRAGRGERCLRLHIDKIMSFEKLLLRSLEFTPSFVTSLERANVLDYVDWIYFRLPDDNMVKSSIFVKILMEKDEKTFEQFTQCLQDSTEPSHRDIAKDLRQLGETPQPITAELTLNIHLGYEKSWNGDQKTPLDLERNRVYNYICNIIENPLIETADPSICNGSPESQTEKVDPQAYQITSLLEKVFRHLMPKTARVSRKGLSLQCMCNNLDDCEILRIAAKTKTLYNVLAQCIFVCWPNLLNQSNVEIEGTLNIKNPIFGQPMVTRFQVNESQREVKTALMLAAENGHNRKLYRLLEQGADITSTDNDGKTALICAAENGHKETVSILLEKGADVTSTVEKSNKTALDYAARENHVDSVRELVNHVIGQQMDIKIFDSALTEARKAGFVEIVKLFLDIPEYMPTIRHKLFRFLNEAAWGTRNELVALYLEYGAVSDFSILRSGFSPLYGVASFIGNIKPLKLLLEHGANPNFTPPNEDTALLEASKDGSSKIVDLLLQYKACTDIESTVALYEASRKGHVDIVDALLAHGVNPDGDSQRQCPLFAAYAGQHMKIVCMLLKRGANPNTIDEKGETLLFQATRSNNVALIALLTKLGGSCEVANKDGDFPLHVAVRCSNMCRKMSTILTLLTGIKITEKRMSFLSTTPHGLIGSGAMMHVTTKEGRTPLQLSLESLREEFYILIQHGALQPHIILLPGRGRYANEPHLTSLLDLCRCSTDREKLVKTLHEAGCFTRGGRIDAVSQDGNSLKSAYDDRYTLDGAYSWLHSQTFKVRSLQLLCRQTIRLTLQKVSAGRSIFYRVRTLQIPRCLQDQILFRHLFPKKVWCDVTIDYQPE